MRPSSRWTYLAAVAVGIALIAAACSSAATATTSVLGATSAPSAAGGGNLAIGTTMSTPLGAYLTGQDGMTLYVRTTDTPDMSTCTGTCATSWPPLTVPSGTMVTSPTGATDSFGTITRSDGTTQVAYNHMPLYYYSGDSVAGDTNGEGKLGIWFVAPLSGVVMSTAPASAAPASMTPASPSGGGYGGY
jgi:predicted lipoprotein with Yx(FWY)xxD motif